MSEESEMDEIFSHIKQLIDKQENAEDNDDKNGEKSITTPEDTSEQMIGISEDTPQEISTIPETVEPIHETTDIGEINAETSDVVTAFTTMMKASLDGWTDDSVSTCDVCKREIVLGKNLTGLVVDDAFFACEDCCRTVTKDELMNWMKSRMIKSNAVRPIGRWLTQEKTKGRSMLFKE